jgi:peptidoglycan/xylan/chitin deacetylase (PgdA/CDA1 family)
MIGTADVIVQAGVGGRRLVHTADSLLRQRVKPSSITFIGAEPSSPAPLVRSAASRLGAIVLDGSAYPGLPLNAAVRSAAGSFFVVVPAGFTLDPTFIERCGVAFHDDVVAALAPSVAYRTADGSGELVWTAAATAAAAILSDTRSVAPVFAVRRDAWSSLGGFDEALLGLVEYDFWLRLVSAGHHASVLGPRLVACQLERDVPDISDDRRAEYFRAVLDRNFAALDRDMREVLITREIRFGQLRTKHRELLVQRDQELAELDRLRAQASHHRAYLQHHNRDGFDWGDFRRTDPVSRDWGYDRGVPVDRRHIDDFLCAHSSDVMGTVLEVQEDDFTLALGSRRVTDHDVLDVDQSNPRATVLADLRVATQIASDTYDCIILTQTLHVIDDMATVLRECHRILKAEGVLLATLPAASRVCLEYGEDGDYWRMTPAGARALFQSAFEPSMTTCEALGNVLTNTAFLHGLSATELADAEFNYHDPYFPALTGVRAKKTRAPSPTAARGVVLLYHRIDAAPDVHTLGVAPDVFEQQLQWLRSECHLIPLDDLLSLRARDLPERAVAVTFDDGYEDNLSVAVPLLQRCQAPAAFFLTTAGLAGPTEYWWDTLERVVLQSSTPGRLDMARAGIPLTFETTTVDERRVAHWCLHEKLVHASLEQRNGAIQWLREWGGEASPRVRPLVADEVRQLAQIPGVAIGAHTVNHLALPANAASRLVEINDCQVELKRIVGQPVELFAYPYGAVDRETAAIIRRSWRWGMSCDDRVLRDSFDAARVPRLDVKAWSIEEFARRVSRLFELP